MRLSIDFGTLEDRYGYEKAAQLLKDAGFSCVDYSFCAQACMKALHRDDYRKHFRTVRATLDRIGLSCNQAHAPFRLCYGYEFSTDEERYLEIVRAMECAAIMGAPHIISHAIYVPHGEPIDQDELNERYYMGLAPYCKQFGVKVGVENIFAFCGENNEVEPLYSKPDKHNELMDKLPAALFTVCVDTGHAGMTGNLPEEYIAAFPADRLGALHIQDGDYAHDCHLPPYLAKFNWEKIVASLKAIGYHGDFTLEIPH